MPRYVLLRHDVPPSFGRPSHWDLLLENGTECLAWALDDLPAAWAVKLQISSSSASVTALGLRPHRPFYLNYEGPISGDRGSVYRVAAGEFEWELNSASHVRLRLCAGTLVGRCELEYVADQVWRLSFHQTCK